MGMSRMSLVIASYPYVVSGGFGFLMFGPTIGCGRSLEGSELRSERRGGSAAVGTRAG